MHSKTLNTHRSHAVRKYLTVILLLSCVFVVPVFAAENNSGTLNTVQEILQNLISLMSRGWVVLAALAGKLMTNDWVFGAALHMDVYLRKIWNIMKNFANFALLGFLLWSIIKGIVTKEKLDIKGIITKTLIAGVLIQASRFVMGALVDLSTVATSAVGAFPMAFMGSNSEFNTNMNKYVSKIKTLNISVDGNSSDPTQMARLDIDNSNGGPANNADIMDSIMPTANSLGGPLVFLGMSTFRFYEYMDVANPDTEQLAIGFSLKAIVLFMYTISLLLLLVANIVRIAFLWIFVIGSPFIILYKVFEKKIGGDSGGNFAKYLSVGTALDLIFKPVIFMAMMSLILVLVVTMQNIMQSQSTIELNGVTMSVDKASKAATLAIPGVSTVTVNDNLFKDVGDISQSVFADLILFFLTAFLMRVLIKWSLTSGEGPIQKVVGKLTEFAEGFAKTTPIFGGQSYSSIKEGTRLRKEAMLKPLGMKPDGTFTTGQAEFQDKLDKLFNLPVGRRESDYDNLKLLTRSTDGSEEFFSKSRELARQKEEGLTLGGGGSRWAGLLTEWLKKNSGRLKDKERGTERDTDLKTFLQNPKNRKKLHELMGGSTATNRPNGPKTPEYEDLINMKYYAGSSGSEDNTTPPADESTDK